jgi:hypothetical protein
LPHNHIANQTFVKEFGLICLATIAHMLQGQDGKNMVQQDHFNALSQAKTC